MTTAMLAKGAALLVAPLVGYVAWRVLDLLGGFGGTGKEVPPPDNDNKDKA